MSIHYQAFIRFLESRGATESQLIEELHHVGRSVDEYSNYLDALVAANAQFNNTHLSSRLFLFANSLYGSDFWFRVFDVSSPHYELLSTVLEPFYEQPLTVEQIIVLFLKHHRKFTHFKSVVTSWFAISTFPWNAQSFGPMLVHICGYPSIYYTRWESLLDHFNLRDEHFDLNTILSMR